MGKHLSLYRSILEYNNDTNRAIPNVSYIKEGNGNKDFYYHAKENSQFPEFPNHSGGPVNGKII